MKRFVTFLVFFFVLICGTVQAQQNIGGVWREVSSNDIKDSIVLISQDGNRITICSSWMNRGSQIMWQGVGSIKGGKIIYQIKHTKYPAGWGVEGTHELELSADGTTMNGKWSNTKGETGPLKFVKIR